MTAFGKCRMRAAGMRFMKSYAVYILAAKSGVLYTGVTNNLQRRVIEHKQMLIAGFTSDYNVNRLVHFEIFDDIRAAIAREKQIKNWRRAKKVKLIESKNAKWADLSEEWSL
jgi:putative endonuclease